MTLDPSVRVHRLAQAVQVADLLVERVEQLLDETLDGAQVEPERLAMMRRNVRRQVHAYRSVRP